MSSPADALTFSPPQQEHLEFDPLILKLMDLFALQDGRLDGRINLLPASIWQQVKPNDLRVWCGLRARYGIPTVELVQWLNERIAGRSAIEIGAGCGDLGFHLRIPMTDSRQQVTDEATKTFLKLNQQTPTVPPPDVFTEDAETAVRRRKPAVVVASWLTQKYIATKCLNYDGDGLAVSPNGNIHGPREEYILGHCETYIFIGNEMVHGDKRIMNRPHETYYFPWLVSRAKYPQKNVIYIWENKK